MCSVHETAENAQAAPTGTKGKNSSTPVHWCTQIPTVEYGHLQHVSKNRSYENVSNVFSQNLIVQSYFSSIKCSVIFLNWSTTLAYLSYFNLNHSWSHTSSITARNQLINSSTYLFLYLSCEWTAYFMWGIEFIASRTESGNCCGGNVRFNCGRKLGRDELNMFALI